MHTEFVEKNNLNGTNIQKAHLVHRGYLSWFANKCSPGVPIYFNAGINESLCVLSLTADIL